MKLVRVKEEHFEFIRKLRNLNINDGFIEKVHITPEQQVLYMRDHWNSYWVCESNGELLGYVGSIEGDIRVAVHPDHMGKGVGTFMINELMKLCPRSFAKVKIDNEASLRLFKKCGFKEKFIILEKEYDT